MEREAHKIEGALSRWHNTFRESGFDVAIRAVIQKSQMDCCLASKVLFFTAFVLWVAGCVLLTRTSFSAYLNEFVSLRTLRLVCLALLLIRELLFGTWNKLAFVGLCAFSLMSFCALSSNWFLVIDGAFFIFAARNIPLKQIVICSTLVLGVIFCITVLGSQIGLIANNTIGRSHGEYLLGFSHPNTTSAFLYMIICNILFLREKRLRIWDILALSSAALIIFYFTGSRTGLIGSITAIVLVFIAVNAPDKVMSSKIVRYIATWSIVAIFISAIALAIAYNPEVQIMADLNKLLSNRLELEHDAFMQYGLHLFGQDVNFSGARLDFNSNEWAKVSNYSWVDCAFVHMLLRWGIVPTFLALAFATLSISSYAKQGNWILVAIGFSLALYGFSELCCVYLTHNVFLVCIGKLFAKDESPQLAVSNGSAATSQ